MNKNEKLEEHIKSLYPTLNGIHKEKFLHTVKETLSKPEENKEGEE